MIDSVLKVIQGIVRLRGGTTGDIVGNVGDRLKTDALVSDHSSRIPGKLVQQELTITTRVQTALPNTVYTVPTGKKFRLNLFSGSYDTQGGVYLRLQKKTGGAGAWATILRISIKQNPQEASTQQLSFPMGLLIGEATDQFQITYETALPKGSLWAGFSGVEY